MVSRPLNARANRQSREGHFVLKGTCQTFAFNQGRIERRGHATLMPAVKTSKSLLLLRIALSVINYCCDKRNLTSRHNGGPTGEHFTPSHTATEKDRYTSMLL